ncbi:MAG: hypothetical protein Q8N99_03340 [Nanoarchaeota archaeon]|nr:hypothetical protein [Nanoarchaeota archaeon]
MKKVANVNVIGEKKIGLVKNKKKKIDNINILRDNKTDLLKNNRDCRFNLNYINIISMFLIFALLTILTIPNVRSLGITPGWTTINYQKGLEQEVDFSVLNNEHKNIQVLLFTQGELNESITLFNSTVEFLPSEEAKSFKYRVNVPNEIENIPGVHVAEVVAMEIPKPGAGGGFVGISQVLVVVPYPGKYLEAELNILDAEAGGNVTFIIPAINRGKVGIGDARASIGIYTALNEKVGSVESDSSQVKSGERSELSAKWLANVNQGNYLAKVTLFYDGETRAFEKQFAIGSQALSIESIMVNNFKLGDIAKLEILVENKWSQELISVFANLLIYNTDNQAMADIKSANENIPALSKKQLIAYWDTVGVSEGEYNGKLMVKYGQKSTDKNLVLKVSEDSIDVSGVGFAIRPKSSGKGISLTTILLALVVVLLIVNLAWFIFFKRMMKKKGQ